MCLVILVSHEPEHDLMVRELGVESGYLVRADGKNQETRDKKKKNSAVSSAAHQHKTHDGSCAQEILKNNNSFHMMSSVVHPTVFCNRNIMPRAHQPRLRQTMFIAPNL